MKRFLILLSLLFCNTVCADTINLHWLNEDGTVYENSTCVIDSDLILPSTPPTKYGYTFTGWKMSNFTPIEYLESTGTQAIDTGVFANFTNFKIEIKALKQLRYSLFGSNDKTMLDFTGASDGTKEFFHYTPDGSQIIYGYSVNVSTSAPQIFVLDSGTLYADGVECYPSAPSVTGTTSTTIYLFARNRNNSINDAGKHKIYYCKIWNNGILVRDFIPVLDYNGVPCMYDSVTQQFFYNQGTGQFIPGPTL